MRAQELMSTQPDCCTPEDTAQRAAEIMRRRNCGFVPIVRDTTSRKLEAVVTDRDLALFLGTSNRLASQIKLREFCTRNPRRVSPETDIREVEALMETAHIHRVPVTQKDGTLVGVISLKDLAEEAWKERGAQMQTITDEEIGEIVEAIAIAR